MKKLIICEGKNDSVFLKHICQKLGLIFEKEMRIFDQTTRDTLPTLKHAEHVEFNRFIQKSYPHTILVKSEAGRKKAVDLFSFYLIFCLTQRGITKVTLLLDLDERGSHLRDLEHIKNEIIRRRVGQPIMIESQIAKQDKVYCLVKNIVKFKHNNEKIGDFFVLYFN